MQPAGMRYAMKNPGPLLQPAGMRYAMKNPSPRLQPAAKRDKMKIGFQTAKTQRLHKAGMGLLAMGVSLLAQCAHQRGSDYTLTAARVRTTPVIDGLLDEVAWQEARPVVLRNNRTGEVVAEQAVTTRAMACHDDSTLYIAFRCNDPDIWSSYQRRDEHLWEEEAIEVFIDTDDVPETYVEIEVSPANVLFDSYIVDPQHIDIPATAAFDLPGIRTAVQVTGTLNRREDTDTRWQVEMAIPFRDLATERSPKITAGATLRINFFRLDKNTGRAAASYAWSPTGGRFHNPAVFGKLHLQK